MLLPEIRWEITNTIVLNAFWIGALLTVTLTGIYTVLGGLRAVVYTDTIQTVILLVSSFFITAIGLDYGTVAGRITPNKATFRRTATDDSITEALGNYMGWEVYRHK